MLDLENLISEDFGKKAPAPPDPTHCDVPLKYNKQRAAVGRPGHRQRASPGNRCENEWRTIQEVFGMQSVDYYDLAHAQYYLLNTLKPGSLPVVSAEFQQQCRVSEELWKTQSAAFAEMYEPSKHLPSYELSGADKDNLTVHYERRVFFEEAVLSSGSKFHEPSIYWNKYKGVTFVKFNSVWIAVTKNLFFVKIEDVNYLASRDHLLILSDLASQRYLLRRWAILEQYNPSPSFVSLGILEELLEIGDTILRKGGNQAYELLYKMEPLALSYLIGDMPVGSSSGDTFHSLIKDEIMKLAIKMEIKREAQCLLAIFEVANKHGPGWISQLYGLYRIWGHPTLEPLEGTAALKRITTPVRVTNSQQSREITLKFKEEFIKRYIIKNHTWPSLDVLKLPKTNVLRLAYERKGGYPDRHMNYKRDDLLLIKFHKIFPVDPKFDLIELIADKSLSLPTPELILCLQTYMHCGTAIARSVLLNWLHSPIQDPEEFLNQIDRFGFFPEESSIGVREKEREGKLKARLFGLMTLQKRMYIVLTEALLAEHIIPYFPEITMTDSELALDKKRYQFTQSKNDSNIILVSLDFSKWNSNMRKNETIGVFQAFDEMFGFTSCFTRTHEMFESSWMYLLNGSYLPEVDSNGQLKQDIGTWKGHLGGIEGLRQKGWTLWTVSLIMLAAEDMPFKLHLMGQGDNQILKLSFPSSMTQDMADNQLYLFLQRLDNILTTTGPPLKLEETWASRSLYVYGKYLIYKGMPLPVSSKRIARMFRMSNEDYPTMESALSSLSANLTSALACDTQIGALFIMYLAELVGLYQLSFRVSYLQSEPFYATFSKSQSILISGTRSHRVYLSPIFRASQSLSDLQICGLCLYPRSLGGFPVMNLFDCLLRGFPDEVTYDISSLKLIYVHSRPDVKVIIKRMLNPPINSTRSFQLLLEHPTSLNIEVPNAPGESRRTLIIEFLKETSSAMNDYIKTFLALIDSEEEDDFFDYLSEVRPLNPRILSLLAGATAGARARQVAGKLQKTRTIASVARTEGGKDLYSRIKQSEINHLGGVLRVLFTDVAGNTGWTYDKCSVVHSSDLRRESWGTDIVGCDCVPPQEFLRLELSLKGSDCLDFLELDKGYIGIRIDPSIPKPYLKSSLTKGSFPPYRGSVTRQKVTGYGDKLAAQAEPILQKILRVFSLIGWGIKRGGNLHDVCKKLLAARTNLEQDLLLLSDEDLTGSTHHRLQDLRTGHGGAVPLLPNHGTKLVFDTFPLSAYSKGSKNVNLMFQALMSAAVVICGELFSNDWIPSQPVVHLHVKSSCCVREISEELIEGPEIPSFLDFYTNPDNKFLFVDAKSIQMRTKMGLIFTPDETFSKDRSHLFSKFHNILAEEAFHLLSPHQWDNPVDVFHVSQLVINWVLPAHTSFLVVCICFRILCHYIGTVSGISLDLYLSRVAERVDRSPINFWKRLSAIVFAPGFHHHISGPSLKGKVHGDPVMGEESIARTMRWTCSGLIKSWSENLADLKRIVLKIEPCSRSFCGMSQHPAFQILMIQWIMGELPSEMISLVRLGIISLLNPEKLYDVPPSAVSIANELHKIGKTRITYENLDYLCKLSIPQGRLPSYSSSNNSIEIAGEIVQTYTVESTHNTVTTLSSYSLEGPSTSYAKHFQKIYGVPTSGTYKCLSFIPLLCPQPKQVLCLGDGAGGFSLAFLLACSTTKVCYNSLIRNEIPMQQCPPIPFLPALAGYPQLESRLSGIDITNEIVSDLTDPLLAQVLCDRLDPRPEIITCDAETSSSDTLAVTTQLTLGVIRIARALESPYVVMKVYGKCPHILSFQISIFATHFEKVHLFRSWFSSRWNTEFYLIAMIPIQGYKGTLVKNVWTGHFLKQRYVQELSTLIPKIAQLNYLIPQSTLDSYHSIFGKQRGSHLASEIYRSLPSISLHGYNIYPICVSKWILGTSMRVTGQPIIQRITLHTRSLYKSYVKRWAMNYLLCYVYAKGPDYVEQLERLVEKGTFLWYRLRNKKWDTSLYFGDIPDLSSIRTVKTYPLASLFSPGEYKMLYRLLGILYTLNPSVLIHPATKGREIRGKFKPKDGVNDDLWFAECGWVRFNIQNVSINSRIRHPGRTLTDILSETTASLQRPTHY